MEKSNNKIQKQEIIHKFDPKLDLEHRKLDVKIFSSEIELCKEGLGVIKQGISFLEEKQRTKQSEIEALATIKKSELDLEVQIKKLEGIKKTEKNAKKNLENLKLKSDPILKSMNLLLDNFGVEVVLNNELFKKFMEMQDKLIKISSMDKK